MQKVLLVIGLVVLAGLVLAAVYFSLGLNKTGLFTAPAPAATSVSQSQATSLPLNYSSVIVDPTNTNWTVSLINPSYLQQKLNDFGFWNQDAIATFDPATKERATTIVSASQVIFSISNNSTSPELFSLNGEISFTPYFNSDNGSLAVHFTIANPTGQKISDAIISAAYFITHPDAGLKLIPADQIFVSVTSR